MRQRTKRSGSCKDLNDCVAADASSRVSSAALWAPLAYTLRCLVPAAIGLAAPRRWTAGYMHNANALIGKQFLTEARASLPGILEAPSPETIFDGMELQRLRLHHDQQVPEWE